MIYKIIASAGSGKEHNYLFSCRMGENRRGVLFLNDKWTMSVYGAATGGSYINVKDFPTCTTTHIEVYNYYKHIPSGLIAAQVKRITFRG